MSCIYYRLYGNEARFGAIPHVNFRGKFTTVMTQWGA